MTAALGVFDGTLTTIRAHERGTDGKPNPTYRCLFPEPPPAGIDSRLRGSRHSRRAARRARLDDGAGSDPRDRRLRRGTDRTVADDRCARRCASRRSTTRGTRTIRCPAKSRRSGFVERRRRSSSCCLRPVRDRGRALHHRPFAFGDGARDQAIAIGRAVLPRRAEAFLHDLPGPVDFSSPGLPSGSRVALPSGVNTMV